MEELLRAYDEYVLPTSPTRKHLSTHIISQSLTREAEYSAMKNITLVEDDPMFKASLMVSPGATPIGGRYPEPMEVQKAVNGSSTSRL